MAKKKIDLHKYYDIPKSFDLLGNTISIFIREDIETEGAVGLSTFLENRIDIRVRCHGKDVHRDQVRHTFFHELGHFLMMTMNDQERNESEGWIDMLGGLMHQYDKTKRQ